MPLVIKSPNQRQGEKILDPAQSTDIAPTILDAVGLAVPRWMDGVALGRAGGIVGREKVVVNYKDPVNGKIFDLPTQLAIRWHDYKLILHCGGGSAELYDLRQDPDERKNLAASASDVAKELKHKLQRKLGEQTNKVKLACPTE